MAPAQPSPARPRSRAAAHGAHLRMRGGRGRTMGRRRAGASVAREIDGLEEKLARCRQSMEEVDLKLRREKLSPEGRKSLERERNLLMTKADNYGPGLALKYSQAQLPRVSG
ncbi:coiled-coil domain-containing protein 167 isoform X2 [Zonotrichia albicollis]|uniref:coiled-coil domain-containing protein 167 isoform X2 n=1 Tax=Zonotrichia albicollis TaxID=44394 RepID=UPI000EAB0F27|nr:coiled-coil domain-containing protein 167 isoform X2 [Zonotrichia albicollis]